MSVWESNRSGQCKTSKEEEGQTDLGGPDPGLLAFCEWINAEFSMSRLVGQV